MLKVLTNRTYRHLFLAQVIALVGTGLATVCSRLTFAESVPSLVPGCSSGRSPAYHPTTSSRLSPVPRAALACPRT